MSQQYNISMSQGESSTYPTGSQTALLDSRPALKAQLIERAFVDQKKLMQKLRNRYGTDSAGKNNFKVQVFNSIVHEELN
jgi:hypothetical protein